MKKQFLLSVGFLVMSMATTFAQADMVLSGIQTNTGAKTFLDGTLLMQNAANTFASKFTNTNTAVRTYTLPNFSGTVLLNNTGWGVSGNSGTVAGINFIGTTDNVDLVFKRNNIVSGRIGTNTTYGINAMPFSNSGINNTAIGNASMYSLASGSSGSNNTAIGESSAYGVQGGNNNTNIGYSSGFNNSSGNANITLGSYAGQYELGSNRLYIHNGLGVTNATNMSTNSLIVGTMDAIATNQKLRVNAQVQIQDGTQGADKVFTSDANGVGSWQTPSWITTGTAINYPAGNVGIGTTLATNPNGYRLAVNGKIGAKDVQVETSSTTWPDYVFTQDYRLPSLAEVEKFIQENNHLENVPSAKEIEKDGHSLGEMDKILLKKVEELTLYVIQQQKEIEELKKKIEKKN
jgi:hypothetical protein